MTHQHEDHYNAIEDLNGILGKTPNMMFVGGAQTLKKDHGKATPKIFLPKETTFFLPVDRSSYTEDLVERLKNVLGEDVRLEILFPNTSVGDSEHDQNLIVKIIYAGRSILLPGDASGALLERIREDNPECMEGIDCFVLAHHGSNDSGELTTAFILTQRAALYGRPLLTNKQFWNI